MTLSLNVARMQAVKPSATLGMAAKAKALSKQGVDVVNLSAGEPDFATPHCIVDAARRVLDKRSSQHRAPRHRRPFGGHRHQARSRARHLV